MLQILIVDDQPALVSLTARMLRKCGYETLECVYSRDCMEMIERLRPDVVLLDLTMPSMSGFDIADEIRHNPDLRPARLIAVTGHNSEKIREQTREHGFDYHFVKPLDLSRVLEVLRAIETTSKVASAASEAPPTEQSAQNLAPERG